MCILYDISSKLLMISNTRKMLHKYVKYIVQNNDVKAKVCTCSVLMKISPKGV